MTYTFTEQQLRLLLHGVIDLREEYIHVHGQEAYLAQRSAVDDMVQGLDAERELAAQGELALADGEISASQVLPGSWRPSWEKNWEHERETARREGRLWK